MFRFHHHFWRLWLWHWAHARGEPLLAGSLHLFLNPALHRNLYFIHLHRVHYSPLPLPRCPSAVAPGAASDGGVPPTAGLYPCPPTPSTPRPSLAGLGGCSCPCGRLPLPPCVCCC